MATLYRNNSFNKKEKKENGAYIVCVILLYLHYLILNSLAVGGVAKGKEEGFDAFNKLDVLLWLSYGHGCLNYIVAEGILNIIIIIIICVNGQRFVKQHT